jgi:hypothetical protein
MSEKKHNLMIIILTIIIIILSTIIIFIGMHYVLNMQNRITRLETEQKEQLKKTERN